MSERRIATAINSDINPAHLWEDVTSEKWEDWHWHQQNSIRTIKALNEVLSRFSTLQVSESPVLETMSRDRFSLKVTPYMIVALARALKANVLGAWDAFHWSFVPDELESKILGSEPEITDCIGEELPRTNPVAAVTNFFGNRVLFRITKMCPAYCRYCFRRRMVGDGQGAWDDKTIEDGIAYISGNPGIQEVILSGGDPLILSDARLASIIKALKAIPHIRRLRIDTKALTLMPQRITEQFVSILKENQPFYIIGHFSHPYELTDETRAACARLIDAGIPVLGHTPLLKGINDDERNLALLMQQLVDFRVRPYYLIQFIPTKWTEHFRVPIQRGLELMRYLHEYCSGLSVPSYIVYLPNGAGKVPITPQYIRERTAEGYIFESFDHRSVLYPEPINMSPSVKSQYHACPNIG